MQPYPWGAVPSGWRAARSTRNSYRCSPRQATQRRLRAKWQVDRSTLVQGGASAAAALGLDHACYWHWAARRDADSLEDAPPGGHSLHVLLALEVAAARKAASHTVGAQPLLAVCP